MIKGLKLIVGFFSMMLIYEIIPRIKIYIHGCKFYWSYPHSQGIADDDYFGFIARLMKGLPLYEDWTKGHVFNHVTPLYEYVVALFSSSWSDALINARRVNIVLYVGIVVLLGLLQLRNKIHWTGKWIGILFATAFFLRPAFVWQQSIMFSARPDVLFVFLGSLTLLVAWLFERKAIHSRYEPYITAALGVCCYMAKQPGLAVIASVGGYYALNREWKKLFHYTAGVAATTLAFVIPLEIANHGQFIRSTILHTGNSSKFGEYTMAGAKMMDVEYAFNQMREFIKGSGFIFLVVLIGFVQAAAQRKISVLHIAFLLHFAAAFRLMCIIGGGDYYLIPLWWISVAVATMALMDAWSWSIRARWLNWVTLVALCWGLFPEPFSFHLRHVHSLYIPPQEVTVFRDRVASQMMGWVKRHPNQNILSDRLFVDAQVKAGLIPEIDVTIDAAYVHKVADISDMVEAIRQHKYSLVLSGSTLNFPEVLAALKRYYRRSPEWDRLIVEIPQFYDPTYAAWEPAP